MATKGKKHPGIIKLACTQHGKLPHLLEFDQSRELVAIVRDVCTNWSIPKPERYAFTLDGSDVYVTDENRFDLKNGVVLNLAKTPKAIATEFVQGLRGPDSATVIVEQRSVADSIAVARELRDQNVAGILMEMIHSKLQKNGQENILAAALSPYTSLLQHGLINPDSILDDFVQGIMKLVNSAASSSNVTQSCLRFLAAYVHKCSRGYEIVTRPGGVSLATVTEKVKNPDPAMQCGALCLFNRLVMVAPTEAEKSGILDAFRQDDVFEALRKRVTDPSSAPVQSRDPTFAHELAVFQRLWVNRVAATARTMFSQEEHKPKFRVLRDGLGDASGENSGKSVRTTQAGIVKTNKSLGFTDPNNPHMDFLSPPGVLALENMVHFCRKHQHDYGQVVLDQSSRTDGSACPFVQTSVSVTSLMLHVLGVGQAPADDLYDYIPALFTSQNGFQELFCVLIQVAMKTWREMDAKTSDMAKVLRVVNKQLESVLAVPVLTPPKLPEPGAIPLPEKAPTSMDSFKLALMAITFEDIVKAEAGDWQQLAEEQLVSEAVQDAKERIEEAVTELVRQQRFDVMTQGAWFNVPAKGRLKKDTHFFAILSLNRKTLHYGDHKEKSEAYAEKLSPMALENSFPTEDLGQLFDVTDLPSLHDNKKYRAEEHLQPLLFGFLGSNMSEALEFAAETRQVAAVWMDGLRGLMNKEMVETETLEIVKELSEVQLQVTMLRLGNTKLPKTRPHPPDLPDDLAFAHGDLNDATSA